MNNFEYFAYDRTNNYAVVIKQFETLEAAQKYKLAHMVMHTNATIRYVQQSTPVIPDGSIVPKGIRNQK